MLERVLEPETVESPHDADDYDAMDHSGVNRQFVADLLAVGLPGTDVLDIGTGTALIPIELCRQTEDCRIMAADSSVQMLDLARYNIEIAGLIERIQLDHADARQMPYADGMFHVVMSNTIVHHVAEPLTVLEEAVRVTSPGGLLFFRDLIRPADEATLDTLVQTHAGDANENQQRMLRDSLLAALTLEEIRQRIEQLGFDPQSVQATSDRHWTWTARLPGTIPPPSDELPMM